MAAQTDRYGIMVPMALREVHGGHGRQRACNTPPNITEVTLARPPVGAFS